MLTISGLAKTYHPGGRSRKDSTPRAVSAVSLEVAKGEFFSLLGPSGCGKTTTLRCIAGLESPDEGQIVIGGRVVFDSETKVDVPANKRQLGMVFQSYAIWPHMTVFDNAAYPLRVRGRRVPKDVIRRRVSDMLALVGLEQFADRNATELSGGQQQRLAIVRALTAEPELLILDEPLSNLDATLRASMRVEIKRLQVETGATIIYVTHDQSEALYLSTRVAVMNKGRVVQIGAPPDIYSRPETPFVAEFVGSANTLTGTCVDRADAGTSLVEGSFGRLRVSGDHAPGSAVAICVKPEDLVVADSAEEAAAATRVDQPTVAGTVVQAFYLGSQIEYIIRMGGDVVRARVDGDTARPAGAAVFLAPRPGRAASFPTELSGVSEPAAANTSS